MINIIINMFNVFEKKYGNKGKRKEEQKTMKNKIFKRALLLVMMSILLVLALIPLVGAATKVNAADKTFNNVINFDDASSGTLTAKYVQGKLASGFSATSSASGIALGDLRNPELWTVAEEQKYNGSSYVSAGNGNKVIRQKTAGSFPMFTIWDKTGVLFDQPFEFSFDIYARNTHNASTGLITLANSETFSNRVNVAAMSGRTSPVSIVKPTSLGTALGSLTVNAWTSVRVWVYPAEGRVLTFVNGLPADESIMSSLEVLENGNPSSSGITIGWNQSGINFNFDLDNISLRSMNGDAITMPRAPEVPDDAVYYNGHFYKAYWVKDIITTYDKTRPYFEGLGGYLATITSAQENEFIYHYLKDIGVSNAFFGFVEQGKEGDWRWITGEKVKYTNWNGGEPNNLDDEYYAEFLVDDGGKWNDLGAGEEPGYAICEWGSYVTANNQTVGEDLTFDEMTEAQQVACIQGILGTCEFPTTTVEGPEISAAGLKFSTWELNVGAKFSLKDFGFQGTYDVATGVVKIVLGYSGDFSIMPEPAGPDISDVSRRYQKVKDNLNKEAAKKSGKNIWNYFQSEQKKLRNRKTKLLVDDCNVKIMGYMELRWNQDSFTLLEGGILLGVGIDLSANYPLPYGLYATFGIEADGTGKIYLAQENEWVQPYIDIAFDAGLYGGIGVGYNKGPFKTYLQADIYATLMARFRVIPNASFKLGTKVGARVRSAALGFEIVDASHSFLAVEILPNAGAPWSEDTFAIFALERDGKEVSYEEFMNTAEPISRDYLMAAYSLRRAASSGLFTKNNAYPENGAQLVAFDNGGMLLVWIDDTGKKTDCNMCSVMYSYYNGQSWSVPDVLYENGGNADGVSVSTDGRYAYVVWQRAEEEFDDSISTMDMLKQFDLYVSVFDSADRMFSAPLNVNPEEDETFEFYPMISGNDGAFRVAWVENSENNIFQLSGNNAVRTVSYSADGILLSEETVSETASMISGVAVSADNVFYSVYSPEEGTNVLYTFDGDETEISSYAEGWTVADGTVYYMTDDGLYFFDGAQSIRYSDMGVLDNFTVAARGDTVMLFTTVLNEDFSKTLYYATLDPVTGKWSNFDVYSNTGKNIRTYSPVIGADGKPIVAFNYITEIEEGVTRSSIVVDAPTTDVDISVHYAIFDNEALLDGRADLTVGLVNESSATIDLFDVTITDEDGNAVYSEQVAATLEGFSDAELKLTYHIPEDYDGEVYTISVFPSGYVDMKEENNSVETDFTCLHQSNDIWVIDVWPTADSKGSKSQTCLVCGKKIYVTEISETEACGEKLLWTVDAGGRLTVWGEGAMDEYSSSVKAPWYSYRHQITEVVIEEGVTTVGAFAFQGCSAIESVSLPSTVTGLGASAFALCSSLTEIVLPESISRIDTYAFYKCTALKDITIMCEDAVIASGANTISDTALIRGVPGSTAEAYAKKYSRVFVNYLLFAKGYCGENLMWTLTEDGILTVSGEGAMPNYSSSVRAPWYMWREMVKKVVLEEGVTSVGAYAFQNCAYLKEVDIASTVTSFGSSAFAFCVDIVEFEVPKTVAEVGSYAFYKCESLSKFTVRSDATKLVDSANTLPEETVIYGGYNSGAQKYAEKYNRTFVPVFFFETEGVLGKHVTWSLDDNGVLTVSGKGAMNNFTTSDGAPFKATDAGTVEDFDDLPTGTLTSDIWNAHGAIENVEALIKGTEGSFTVVEEGDGKYLAKKADTSATITLTDKAAWLTNNRFEVSFGLRVDDPKNANCGILSLNNNSGGAKDQMRILSLFENQLVFGLGDKGLNVVLLDESEVSASEWISFRVVVDPATYDYDVWVNGEKVLYTLTVDGEHSIWAYKDGSWQLQSSEGWMSANTSPFTNADGLIKSVHLFHYNGAECSLDNLQIRLLPNINRVVIEEGVTSVGDHTFSYCPTLKEISLPNSVTYIGKAAFYMTDLGEMDIPSHKAVVYDSADTVPAHTRLYGGLCSAVEEYAARYGREFEANNIMTSDTCGDGVTWTLTKQGQIIFSGEGAIPNYTAGNKTPWRSYMDSLTEVIVLEGVTAIGDFAFQNGKNISKVTLSSTVTSVGASAFAFCASLAELEVPASVKQIGSYAFYRCNALADITFFSKKTKLAPSANTLPSSTVIRGAARSEAYAYAEKYGRTFEEILFTVAEGICNESVSWKVLSDGRLVVSGEGTIPDYSNAARAPWYSYYSQVDIVVVEQGITRIGNFAFYNATGLVSAEVADTVTSLGSSAFSLCASLKTLDLPESVRDINSYAFYKCTGLGDLVIRSTTAKINQSVNTIPENARIRGYEGSTAEAYATRFERDFLDVDTVVRGDCGEGVMWKLTVNDELVIFGDGAMVDYTSSVKSPWYDYRNSVKTAIFEDGVTSVGAFAFYGCSSLREIRFGEDVASVGASAFALCSGITEITLPESVTNIGSYAFYKCTALAKIVIDSYTATIAPSANTIPASTVIAGHLGSTAQSYAAKNGRTFVDADVVVSGTCGSGLSWKLLVDNTLVISGSGAVNNYSTSAKAPWYSYASSIQHLVVEEGVTKLGAYAFYMCRALTSISLPESLTDIGASAFAFCEALPSVEIPQNVQNVGSYAFYRCDALSSVKVLSTETVLVPSANTVPETALILGRVDSGAERYAAQFGRSYTAFDLKAEGDCGESSTWKLTTEGRLIIFGEGAMEDYSSSVRAPWYSYRYQIKSVEIKAGITSVGNYAFYNCPSVSSVSLPTSVLTVGVSAFSLCSGLTELELSANVTKVDSYAFYKCVAMTDITFGSEKTVISPSANTLPENAVIHGCEGSTAQAYAKSFGRTFVTK